ncbi:alpha/beta hydrolase [Streptomyces sp. NPDC051578]|uniref:alpha/beta hydrolase n=1 Tax=Streptomyces sp. NPDC051578 TaxID=3365662 RepID=UPI0037BBE8E4
MFSHRRRKAAALTALALSAVAVTTGPAGAATPGTTAPQAAAPQAAAAPALDWHDCTHKGALPGQQCATLPVPLDYGDPTGRQLRVAVTRLRSDRPQARRGTLLVIPGGPGGSGVQKLTSTGPALAREMAGAYDLVSLDPRGVGGSSTASCGLAEEDRHLVTLRSWPGADGDIAQNVARSRRIAEACAEHGGPELRSFTTANEVRDIDRLRQALGERKLSVWGTSYGTYVGAVYAQRYPQHTDRVVLDSSGDPDPTRVARGWLANMAAGADDRFPDFAAWAADPARDAEGLRLAAHPEDVRPLFLEAAAKLDREPRQSDVPGVPLTGNRLRQALQTTLYGNDFAPLARLLLAAQDPAAEPVLPPDVSGPLPDTGAAAVLGAICNDVSWPADVAAYERAVAADRTAHPLTAGMPANITPCSFWKDRPEQQPTRITPDGPSNVLMVQNLRDPATPYAGALKMREAFGSRARLVSVDAGGHGSYLGNGNACGDRTVTRFLTTGQRPRQDTYCGS